MSKKVLSVLGSTGSIGRQTLDVARGTPGVRVAALAADKNIGVLEEQIREFVPVAAAVRDKEKAFELKKRVSDLKTEILGGDDGVSAVAGLSEAGLVVNGIVGIAGLLPTVAAVKAGKSIALANKETIVAGGSIVMNMARERGAAIIPVDGEHSAVFQCLRGNEHNAVNKIFLTASGGPFRGFSKERMKTVTLEETLNHPIWNMGAKITVDSATMMNKGLEVIEARFLFDIPAEKIDVLIHPQSVIHSMVEFEDGAVMAQLGTPDMRLPIQYAVNYPDRLGNSIPKLDFTKVSALTFEQPRFDAFPCLRLAYDALAEGGTAPAALSAANEIAVGLFLQGRVKYTDIAAIIERTMGAYTVTAGKSVEDIMSADKSARETALKFYNEMEL